MLSGKQNNQLKEYLKAKSIPQNGKKNELVTKVINYMESLSRQRVVGQGGSEKGVGGAPDQGREVEIVELEGDDSMGDQGAGSDSGTGFAMVEVGVESERAEKVGRGEEGEEEEEEEEDEDKGVEDDKGKEGEKSEEDEDEHHGKHDAEGGDTSDDDDDASASTRKSLVNLIVTGKRSRKPNPLYLE